MKKILLIIALAVLIMACNKSGTSIKVNKTKERYELIAAYPKRKDEKVMQVLKTAFKRKDSLLLTKSVSDGKEITLANGTVFYLRYNPGKLEMEMLLQKNNRTGLKYFDEMAANVKTALN